MSIEPNTLKKRSIKELLNEPLQFRNIIHLRSSHKRINPQKTINNSPKAKLKQSSITESMIQKVQRKSSISKNSQQSPKQVFSKSLQKQKSNQSKNEDNKIGSLIKNLNTSIKSFKEVIPSSHERLITVRQIKICEKAQKAQQIQIKLQKQKSKTKKIYTIDEINEQLQYLVTRKLKLVMKEAQKNNDLSSSISKILKKKINQQLLNLIQVIKSIQKSSTSTQLCNLNQKIYFIETLIAEHNIEAQLMKKYYFKLTSNKKKGKVGDFSYFQHSFTNIFKQNIYLQRQQRRIENNKYKQTKPFFGRSISRQSYKTPSLSDYESYRYKQTNFTPNLQPLPRSTYKRDFLIYKTSPDEIIVSKDHAPYFPCNKETIKSIYQKDYKQIKAETINHKQLDAYKDKFKILKFNYMPNNKLNNKIICSKSRLNNATVNIIDKSPTIFYRKISLNEKNFNKHIFKSEAHRSFIGEQLFERSRIKHQQLKQFQYHLKRLFKA